MPKNILVLFGGGGTEHEISEVSVKHIIDTLSGEKDYQLIQVELTKLGPWKNANGQVVQLNWNKELVAKDSTIKIDAVIPCIHGYPGETGDLQSFFEMIKLPYIGCGTEASRAAFNKITTKLWAEKLDIPVTPYLFMYEKNDQKLKEAKDFLALHGEVVVKASNQGSSVGCYLVEKEADLEKRIDDAFALSPYVLLEKRLLPREIELSAYELDGKIQVSYPGEIVCPSKFYSYEEKYSKDSKTYTEIKASGLKDQEVSLLQDYSRRIFQGLKLRHLSRIDFFMSDGKIYLNEVNTFPGLTPISMFPKMLEANGHSFKEFLRQNLQGL